MHCARGTGQLVKQGEHTDGESSRAEAGFTLLEATVALAIWGMLAAVTLPGFIHASHVADLRSTTRRLVADLRTAQAKARAYARYEEVRFAPYANFYYLFDIRSGVRGPVYFRSSTEYFDGYNHLPLPTLRFDDYGDVNQSGRVMLVDPEGDLAEIVIYMQFGQLHTEWWSKT